MSRFEKYEDADALREIIQKLKNKKYCLDCGHHVTFGYYLGQDITILNGKEPRLLCSQCGH